MNKYADFFLQYLDQHKELTLQKIGTLFRKGSAYYDEATHEIQEGEVAFSMDKKAMTSPGFIDFIAEHTGKNKTLVTSDLESYLEQGRQFINIGDTFFLPGIGSITKNNTGTYVFTAEAPVAQKVRQKEKLNQERETGGYYAEQSKKNTNKGLVMFFAFMIIVLLIGGMGWGVYKLYFEKKPANFSQNEPQPTDTIATQSQQVIKDTIKNVPPLTDTSLYKFIFEKTTSRERAVTRTAKLHEYGNDAKYDSIQEQGLKTYRLYLLYKTKNFADTIRVKDSLFRYFQKPISIEPVQ